MRLSGLLWILVPGLWGQTVAGSPPDATPAPRTEYPVTLPFLEWKRLWTTVEAAEHAEQDQTDAALPPVAAVVTSAEYGWRPEGDDATLDATYHIRSFESGWVVVPLLGGDFRLDETIETEHPILWHENRFCVATLGAGDFRIGLRFRPVMDDADAGTADAAYPDLHAGFDGNTITDGAPITGHEFGKRELQLTPGPASRIRVRIAPDSDGRRLRIRGLQERRVDGAVVYDLPPTGGPVTLVHDGTDQPAPIPSTWRVESETLVHFDDGRLFFQCRIDCEADDGDGLSMTLAIPRNALEVTVQGEDLSGHRLGAKESEFRPLHIRWRTREILNRRLQITYRIPQTPLADTWVLQAPALRDGGETSVRFVMQPVDGLELTSIGSEAGSQSESDPTGRLSAWMHDQVGGSDYLTRRTDGEWRLRAKAIPRVRTAPATVARATCATRLVTDGATLVNADYVIDHQSPIAWRVQLPALDQVLVCQLDDQPAHPLRRGPTEIEFLLNRSDTGASRVSLAYTARADPLDPVSGRVRLELPRTDLFVHKLDWVLTIPEAYELTALDGNMSVSTPAPRQEDPDAGSGTIIHLMKELIRDEAPLVDVFYQRRGIREER